MALASIHIISGFFFFFLLLAFILSVFNVDQMAGTGNRWLVLNCYITLTDGISVCDRFGFGFFLCVRANAYMYRNVMFIRKPHVEIFVSRDFRQNEIESQE